MIQNFLARLISLDTVFDIVFAVLDEAIKNPGSQQKYENTLKALARRINKTYPEAK